MTSRKDAEKIQETLDKYDRHGLETDFGQLTILIIGEPQSSYGTVVIPDITFDLNKDIVGIKDLMRTIERLDTAKLQQLTDIIHEEMAMWPLPVTAPQRPIVSHDTEKFYQAHAILPESSLNEFLDRLLTNHSYSLNASLRLTTFRRHLVEESNVFVTASIVAQVNNLIRAIHLLEAFLCLEFFVYPTEQNDKMCLAPSLSRDPKGPVKPEDVDEYQQKVKELERLVADVSSRYRDWRRSVREALLV